MPAVLARALARYRRAVVRTERAKRHQVPGDGMLDAAITAERAARDEVLAAGSGS